MPSWRYIFYCTLVASIACFLLSLFIPESPKYLISVNRVEAAKKSMKQIAKINGTYDTIIWRDFKFDSPLN